MKWLVPILAALSLLACGQKTDVKNDIEKAFKAANRHDYPTFEKYVDVQGLEKSFVRACLNGEDDIPSGVFGSSLNAKINNNLREFIETNGAIDYRALHMNNIKIDGAAAYVIADFIYPKYSIPCSFTMRLRKNNDCWQIADIDLLEAIKKIRSMDDSACDFYNNTMAKEMANKHLDSMSEYYKDNPPALKSIKSDEYFQETYSYYKHNPESSSGAIMAEIFGLFYKKGNSAQ
jgi:hypothetical protein